MAVGADNHAGEVTQALPPAALPVHHIALRVIAPLRLTSGTGSPLNPIAIA